MKHRTSSARRAREELSTRAPQLVSGHRNNELWVWAARTSQEGGVAEVMGIVEGKTISLKGSGAVAETTKRVLTEAGFEVISV